MLAETLAQLGRAPLPMDAAGPGAPTRLTAPLFEVILGQALYDSRVFAGLPGLIRAVHEGQAAGLGPMLAAPFAELRSQNRAANAAVECRDRAHWRRTLPTTASVLDRAQLYGICAEWSVPGPAILLPTGTAIPTLVLAGRFDPVARPARSRAFAAALGPSAQWIELPTMGHNIRGVSPCGTRIAAAFIDAPERALDTGCVAGDAPIRFALP